MGLKYCPFKGVVVDVGCGTGLLMEHLEEHTIKYYICLDCSPLMLSRAKERSTKLKLNHLTDLVEALAESLPLRDRVVDITYSFTVLTCSNLGIGLTELIRITRSCVVVSILKASCLIEQPRTSLELVLADAGKDWVIVCQGRHIERGAEVVAKITLALCGGCSS